MSNRIGKTITKGTKNFFNIKVSIAFIVSVSIAFYAGSLYGKTN